MSDSQLVANYVAGIIFVVSASMYARTIALGTTKTSIVSWVVWWILDIIMLSGMKADEAMNDGQAIGAVAGSTIVVLTVLWYGTREWTWIDTSCLCLAGLGLFLWWSLDSPAMAIGMSSFTSIIAMLPVFESAIARPEEEDLPAWCVSALSCPFGLYAVPEWTVKNAASAITLTIIIWGVTGALAYHYFFTPKKEGEAEPPVQES